jgi:transcription initiation factor TFIIB
MNTLNGRKYDGVEELTNYEIEDLLKDIDDYCVPERDNSCPECGSVDFIEDYSKGMILCHCGQVMDNILDTGIEKRNYDGEDNDAPRCGMVYNVLLPQSSLGTTITAKGKLRKLHIWNSMPYKERSDNIMFKRIREICVTRGIVKKIEDDAKILCKRVSGTVHTMGKNKGKPIITRGFNRAGIVAACLFIACRRNEESRSTKEIASYFDIDERDVNKGLRSLLTILNGDNIVKDIGTSKVIHFIKRKCDELHIKTKHADIAVIIAMNIERLNMASNHTTFSLAAASILLMAEIIGIKTITKKKLSSAFYNLSDVTIGKTYKQIKDYKTILIDNAKVGEIMIEIARQQKKHIITQKVWDQMKRFNINTSKYILEGDEENDESYEERQKNEKIQEISLMNNNEIKVSKKSLNEKYQDLNDDIDVMNDSFYFGEYDWENQMEENDWTHQNDQFMYLNDGTSEDSYGDFECMVNDIKNTIHELKYTPVSDDGFKIVEELGEKIKILNLYVDQWALEKNH